MLTIWLDAEKVRRFLAVAAVPWERESIETALVDNGWAGRDGDGCAQVTWGEGYFPERQSLDAVPQNPEGWWMNLGVAPPVADESSAIELPCGYAFPAFGAESEASDRPDEFAASFGPGWLRVPNSGPSEFRAEYRRIRALINAQLGCEPDQVISDRIELQEIWSVAAGQLVLFLTDDADNHSHYDVIGLQVGPSVLWH